MHCFLKIRTLTVDPSAQFQSIHFLIILICKLPNVVSKLSYLNSSCSKQFIQLILSSTLKQQRELL